MLVVVKNLITLVVFLSTSINLILKTSDQASKASLICFFIHILIH